MAVGGPWRRHRLGPPLVVLAVTFGTLVCDVLTGSTLELNGLLGYDAIVAGRFTGYGNLSFGLLSVSALLVTAAVATVVGRRAAPPRARAATGGTVLAIGIATVLLIGAPQLGRDFGGVLAALPGFLLLAMLLAHVRVTVVRFLAILAAAVVTVGTVAVLDWLRPAADRSHLGRFVEQVLTGEAWTVISRKGQANLDILLRSPLAWMIPVAIVAADMADPTRRTAAQPVRRRRARGPGSRGRRGAEVGAAGRSAEPGARRGGERLGRRSAGRGGRAAGAADGVARRRHPQRGYRNGGDGGWISALRTGRGRGACYGRFPWIDRLEHVTAAFFTTPSRRSSSSSPAALCPHSARG